MSNTLSPRLAIALDLAKAGLPLVPAHHLVPFDRWHLSGCSCTRPDCLTPAAHPIRRLTVDQATTSAKRLLRWWGGGAYAANLATVAGMAVEVIELRHPSPHSEVAAWLRANQVEPGPALDLGDGRTQFLAARTDVPVGWYWPLPSGWATKLEHGSMVLLPPSRQADGLAVEWLTGPVGVELPDCRRLFHALKRLPTRAVLAAYCQVDPDTTPARRPPEAPPTRVARESGEPRRLVHWPLRNLDACGPATQHEQAARDSLHARRLAGAPDAPRAHGVPGSEARSDLSRSPRRCASRCGGRPRLRPRRCRPGGPCLAAGRCPGRPTSAPGRRRNSPTP
jgi:hypothetical protein